MEEADRERELGADPSEPELDEEEKEQQAVPPEAPLPYAGDETDDHEDQPEQNDEVAPSDMEPEPVREHLVVDRRAFVVELVGCVERAVAGKPDLHDDRSEQEHRPNPVHGTHAQPPGSLTARA